MKHVRLPDHFSERKNCFAAVLVSINMAVVAGGGIAAHWLSPPLWIFTFLLVGARGQACYILQHEAMHNLLFSNRRTNEYVGLLLSAFLGTQFYFGRALHMKHHRNIGSSADPNRVWHDTANKKPFWQFFHFLLFQMLGGRLLWLIGSLLRSFLSMAGLQGMARHIRVPSSGVDVVVSRKHRHMDLAALAAVQAGMIALFAFTSVWWAYFVFYVLPLSTATAFFEAIRSFSEHVLPGTSTSEAEKYRRFYMKAGPIERFFVSQFGFHYHHVHHLFANVPTFNVKAAHHWLDENAAGFREAFIERPGYVKTAILYLLERPFPGRGAEGG